ncbi:short-chain dehydrogenase [Trametopsis cervina]|nr:short-chain dehydrogenase [Trametopsis cervina]
MGKLSTLDFLVCQFTRVPPVLTTDLAAKTVVVVGANAGIGLECSKHFAKMRPARLILACRSEQKGRQAVERIAQDTSYKAELELVDMTSFESVSAFAERLEGQPIDIVVLNAGVLRSEYKATQDGWEESVQVNHLSTALISFLLVPNLLKAAEINGTTSRLVLVASEVHFWTKFTEEHVQRGILAQLNDKEISTPKVMGNRYFDSKLLNVLFTRAFFQHLSPSLTSSLVPTCANPGLCKTNLATPPDNNTVSAQLHIAASSVMLTLLARTAERGARQLVWAALGPDGRDGPHVKYAMGGAYVSLARVDEPSDFVVSREGWVAQEALWKETVDVLVVVAPQVKEIVGQYFSG